MMKVLYILLALLILMVLITVHEFGHYTAGKIFKFKINEFSIGFGKAIYKKTKKNGEIFSVRILPIGGYCAFEGEDEENPGKDAFNSRPAWQRLIVLFSGVFFNFIFGVIASAIMLMSVGYAVPKVNSIRAEITQQYDLRVDDQILAVNGTTIEAYRSLSDLTSKYSDNTLTLSIKRGEETFDIVVTKQTFDNGYFYVANDSTISGNIYALINEEDASQGYQKVDIADFKSAIINADVVTDTAGNHSISTDITKFYSKTGDDTYTELDYASLIDSGYIAYASAGTNLGFVYSSVRYTYGFFESLGKAWPYAFYVCKVILNALGGIFTGATQIKELGGTITTISTVTNAFADNSAYIGQLILSLFSALSINLAVFNILPIPALDGARMCFVLWEVITRKPVNRKLEGWIHTVGLFVLLALVIVLDILHFVL